MELLEKALKEYTLIQKQKRYVGCKHKSKFLENGEVFCASCGEQIPWINSSRKKYSEGITFRHRYDRTIIFTEFLDKWSVDIFHKHIEIMRDFEDVVAYHKSKSKRFMNLNLLLYQLCKKNGLDVNEANALLLKTKKSRVRHENICKEIFKKLGWSYFSIL